MVEVCKDIDKGLADLQAAINRLNNRLDNLEKRQNECCNQKNKPPDNKNNSDLESRVVKIEGYINALDKDVKAIAQIIIDFGETIQGIFKALEEFFGKAIDWIGSAAKLFEIFK